MAELGAIGYAREPTAYTRAFNRYAKKQPVCVNGEIGQLYWNNSIPTLVYTAINGVVVSEYKIAASDVGQTPLDPDGIGFKWYRPGAQKMKWPVAAGARTLKVTVKKSIDTGDLPRVRLLANAALGVSETIVSVAAGVGTYQTITVNVSPTSPGILFFYMEQPNTDPVQIVSWGTVEMT